MVKKLMLSTLALILVLSLVACSATDEASPAPSNNSQNDLGLSPVTLEKSMENEANYDLKYQENFNTEDYSPIEENIFLDTIYNPLSTFSIDVDTASYSNIRRFINNGNIPPKDAVRIEEMINYFDYDFQGPNDYEPIAITVEGTKAPWDTKHNLVMVNLKGKNIDYSEAPPSNLVFLIDVSGSMGQENKLPLLKSAFKMLVNNLREQDRVSIVTYAGNAAIALESTPGSQKEKIIRVIDSLGAGGSTAGAEGITNAYAIAKENYIEGGNNRVILATDGDFNVGISSDAELTRLIEDKRDEGIYLSVLGFGMGNYKDNKMETLADKGNGNYGYIDNLREAKKVFVSQLTGTLFTIAKDVKIQVEFNPAKVKGYRLLGYENRALNNEDFNDDKKDAGEMGAGHSVTVFYELIPADSDEQVNNVDDLKYQETNIIPSNEMMTVKIRYKEPNQETSKKIETVVKEKDLNENISTDFKFASAVAEFGLLLRDSKFKGDSTFEHVINQARDSRGEDKEGYRIEFIQLVETYKNITGKK